MISVRLSEQEYSALMNLCTASGARSVSDLARGAMQMLAAGRADGNFSQARTDAIELQIQLLIQKVDELNERVQGGREPVLRLKPGDEPA